MFIVSKISPKHRFSTNVSVTEHCTITAKKETRTTLKQTDSELKKLEAEVSKRKKSRSAKHLDKAKKSEIR